MEQLNEEREGDWDTYNIKFLDQHLWLKFNENKYIRRDIFYNKNLNNNNDDNDDDNDIFKSCYQKVDEYLSFNISLSPFKNIAAEKEKKNDDDDDYLNTNYFKNRYKILMKNIYAIDSLSSNAITLLLCKIFDLCNVVAFDLEKEIIIIIRNYKIYIIFYKKDNKYIKLDLSIKKKKNDDDDDDDDNYNDKYYNIQYEIKEFIRRSDMNFIYNYYNTNKLDKSIHLTPIPSSLLLSTETTTTTTTTTNNNNNNKKWSNWDSPKQHYFVWHINKNTNTCSRSCIHFKFNLKDIYDKNNKEIIMMSYYPIQTICENLQNFNYLYILHEALIYNNVIHINFNKCYFITLNVIEENVCEFKTISFLPLSYRGMSSNDLTIPFSNFKIKVSFDKLYYHEYISFIL